MEATYQVDLKAARKYLSQLLEGRLDSKGQEWLKKKRETLLSDPSERNFYLTFGAAPRFVGKATA